MSRAEDMALVDRLRMQSSETEWLEFKQKRCAPEQIGQYLSALANSACLVDRPEGYLILGIEDGTHKVAGTDFDPYRAKGRGNQDLLPWLEARLRPQTGFEARVVDHPDGRVVVFEVASAKDQPVSFLGTAYVRVGASKTELAKHPTRARAIWTRELDWSGQLCESATVDDLDPAALIKARIQFIERHSAQEGDIHAWDDLTFLHKTRLFRDGTATNAALLLLGRPESASLLTDGIAWLVWILKDADNNPLDIVQIDLPFFDAGNRVLQHVRNLPVRFMPKGTLLPKQVHQYDPWVVREVVHNAIAHQDYYMRGRISAVEFPDRIIVNNAGAFLPGSVETVVRRDAPGPRYRNPLLAGAMYALGIIDSQGGGIRKMFETQRRRFFPLPDYDLAEYGYVEVTIHGRLFGEAYPRLLLERPDMDLEKVMLLDRVQKGLPISSDAHLRLEAEGLLHGAHPHHVVADPILDVTAPNPEGTQSALTHQHYVDMVVGVVVEHGPVGRSEIEEVLLPELPNELTDEQKRTRVRNLLQMARQAGRIVNAGSRSRPAWVHAGRSQTTDAVLY